MQTDSALTLLANKRKPPQDAHAFMEFTRANEKQYAGEIGKLSFLLREAGGVYTKVLTLLNSLVPDDKHLNDSQYKAIRNQIRDMEKKEWIFDGDVAAIELVCCMQWFGFSS